MAKSLTSAHRLFDADELRHDAKLWRNAGQREENARTKREGRQALERQHLRVDRQSNRYRQLRKEQRYNAKLYRIARRLPAIVRVKHGGILRAPTHYAPLLFVQGGALKDPAWGDAAMRQRLINDAIDYAVQLGAITRMYDNRGMVSFSVDMDDAEPRLYAEQADPLRFSRLICSQSVMKELAYH